MASNGAKHTEITLFGNLWIPNPKYGTYIICIHESIMNTESVCSPQNRSGRSLDNVTFSKASNGELWTMWQEVVVSEIDHDTNLLGRGSIMEFLTVSAPPHKP